MKKNKLLKTFLLLTAMLVGSATNVLGQTTLFLWQSDGSTTALETSLTATGGTAAFYGTASPSTENAAYNEAVTDTDLKATGTKGHKLGTNTLYLKITLTGEKKLQAGDIIYICGYKPFRVGTGVTSDRANTDLASSLTTGSSKSDYNVGSVTVPSTIGNNVTEIYLSRADGTGTGLAAVKIVRPTASAPTGLTFNPAEGTIITGKEITLSAIGATSIKWQWGSAAVTDTGDSSWDTAETYSDTNKPIAGEVGTTNNVLSMLASNATGKTVKSATYTIKASATPHTQTTVDGERTWDWAEQTCNWSSDLNCSEWGEFVMADFDGEVYEQMITFTADFDATALKVSGQYPFRSNSNKYFQNAIIKLTTTVPGTLEFTFSNTGSSNKGRYVVVTDANGTHTGTVEAEGTTKKTESFDVVAGDITIDGTNNGGIRIYKIVFSPTVEDTEAPTLSSSTPENGATNVAVSGTIVLTFNESIATVDATKFSMTGATMGTVEIDGTDSKKVNVAYSGAENEATVTLSVAAGAVADAAGNASAALSDISFTTKPEAATLTAVSDYMWTFDGDNWESSYAQNSEEVVANNLGILASNTAIAIDGNNKSMDGYSFTKRLKLGGAGSATTQNVHFKVAGACKITVYGMSGKSSDTRPLGITANDVEEATDFPGDRLYKAVYYYTGTTATDVYVYSKDSGINIYGIKVEPITDASVTISSAKFASFSDGVARDFSATGITVYTAKATGTSVQLTEVTDGIVPANTGVVLYSESEVTEVVPMVTTTKTTLEDNEMVANVSGAKVAKAGEDGKTNYILSNETDGVGFYLAVEGGAYLPANRAYLSTTATASTAPFLGFDGNETTAIENIQRSTLNAQQYYDLSGRRVEHPTKGLYIVNGKKVLVP